MSSQASGTAEDVELTRVLDACLTDLEAGRAIDVERITAEHPAIATRLRACLASLQLMEHQGRDLAPAADADAAPPPRLGDYRLIREVGRGGMGVVYEAVQESLGRRVALKVLPFAATLDPRQLQRFKTEAQAAAGLHHTNIVPVFGVGSERGVHYYAMQFIDGRPLSDLIDPGPEAATPSAQTEVMAALSTEGRIGGREFCRAVARLGIQAALALEHAHEFGVIHRDVKPANLLLDVRGHLWVTDFGLAQCQSNVQVTLSGDVVGTLRYMSPEQALAGRDLVDQRTDIYGLGATLYELLTRRPVFNGRDRQELLRQIAQDEPRWLRRLAPAVPVELESIVHKALARDPAERYATASEMAADLQRFLEDRPILARRPTRWQRVVKWARRHRTLVAAGVGFLVLATVALAVSTVLVWQALGRERRVLGELELALERERVTSYRRAVVLAQREWAENQVGNALRLLEQCPPEMRRWEWHYLNRLCHAAELTFAAPGPVVTGGFTSDGRLLAVSSGDGPGLVVHDARSGRPVLRLPDHPGSVKVAALSSGGLLATTSDGPPASLCEVGLWDLGTGKQVHVLRGHVDAVTYLAFSGDGRWLASASLDCSVRVWDVDRGRAERPVSHREAVRLLALSHDGRRVASASGKLIRVWEEPGGPMIAMSQIAHDVDALDMRHDGAQLAVGLSDRSIRILGVHPHREYFTLAGHTDTVRRLAYAPNGLSLASGGADRAVQLWNLAAARATGVFRGHQGRIHALSFSANGRRLATLDEAALKVWDPEAEQTARVLLRTGTAAPGIAFSPDGKTLAVPREGGKVALIDAASGAEQRVVIRHGRAALSVAFSPDGRRLASGGGDQTVRLWDSRTGDELGCLTGIGAPVESVAFSPDGRWLAAAGWARAVDAPPGRGAVQVWDTATQREVLVRRGPDEGFGVAFSLDGTLVACAGRTGVSVCRSATGEEVLRLAVRLEPPAAVAIAPDGRSLAVATPSGSLTVWPLEPGPGPPARPPAELRGHTELVRGLAYSPDGHRLASAGLDRTLRLWDVASGEEVLTLPGHQGAIGALAFSPDGRQIVTTGADLAVRLWEGTPLK